MSPFTANGRSYNPPPIPIAAICLDGSADEYLNAALARGLMPNLNRISVDGFRGVARAAMPTFTNVNNTSIVTGAPPSVHGIVGNYFLDPKARKEVMMNSSQFLRAGTIFPAAQAAGRKVAVATAKDKLREILGCGLVETGGIAFSAEKAGEAISATHGIQGVENWLGSAPPIYSAEASLYALRAGSKLIERAAADFLYLSTTDYIQHKHAPDEPEALQFYAAIDREIGHLVERGALVGLTADHGMSAKQKPDGSPNVIYLESLLDKRFCPGFRVILPITDPYVVHHGALGSFAQVHLPPANGVSAADVLDFVRRLDGVTEAMDQDTAARLMQLPADRMGDLVVCAGRDVALGRTPEWHNLSALEGRLRSHGGRYEEMVPFVLSAPPSDEYAAKARGDLRNFDLFDFLCNGTQL